MKSKNTRAKEEEEQLRYRNRRRAITIPQVRSQRTQSRGMRYARSQNTKYVCPHVVVIQSHLRILPQTPELDGRRGQFLFQILLNTVKARRRYRQICIKIQPVAHSCSGLLAKFCGTPSSINNISSIYELFSFALDERMIVKLKLLSRGRKQHKWSHPSGRSFRQSNTLRIGMYINSVLFKWETLFLDYLYTVKFYS